MLSRKEVRLLGRAGQVVGSGGPFDQRPQQSKEVLEQEARAGEPQR